MVIKHLEEQNRFVAELDGFTARLDYKIGNGGLDIRHTIVPQEIGGHGVASALVKAAADYAVANNLRPVATCSYAVVWFKRHPEYNGIKSDDYAGEGCCVL